MDIKHVLKIWINSLLTRKTDSCYIQLKGEIKES